MPSTSCTQTYEETEPALKLFMMLIPLHYPHVGCCVHCMAQNKISVFVINLVWSYFSYPFLSLVESWYPRHHNRLLSYSKHGMNSKTNLIGMLYFKQYLVCTRATELIAGNDVKINIFLHYRRKHWWWTISRPNPG